jgi:metal-responsive CopG/Arc/MetJ family transcriptional regulator
MLRKKVQITLPEELKSILEIESKKDFMSLSSWIERAAVHYLERNKKETSNVKKIDLGI